MHGSKLNQAAKSSYIQSYSKKIIHDFFSQNEDISGQQVITLTRIKQLNSFILKELSDEWQEETKKFNSPYFNYKNEDVSSALKTLVNTLSKNILIKKEDLEPLVERAVNTTLELLYQPASYFQKEIDKIKRDKLKEFKTYGKYIKLYRPLFDKILLNLQKEDVIDYDQVVSQTVDNFQDVDNEQTETIRIFDKTLKLDVVHGNGELESPLEGFLQIGTESDTSMISDESTHALPSDIAYKFERIKEEQSEVERIKNINDQSSKEVNTLNKKYQKQSVPEPVGIINDSKSLSVLKNNININQRYIFVNDLFEGNDKDYEIALDEVEDCKSFDSSVELLVQKYAKKYVWDMNSDEVKELLKVIFKRFR